MGAGGQAYFYTSPQPGTVSFCYLYAAGPTRTLFYRSEDCTPQWGWGFDDPYVGLGGQVWAYTSPQPNTVQYCYRYASDPTRTLFYRSDDCSPNWGWGWSDPNVGAGGAVYLPTSS